MKNSIVISSFILFSLNCVSQERSISQNKVSNEIKSYLSSNYPLATKKHYYTVLKEGINYVETEFKAEGKEYSLLFQNNVLVETEVEIKFNDIPTTTRAKILATLDSLYTNYSVEECQQVNPTQELFYEIYIDSKTKQQKGEFELFFDANGDLVSKKEVELLPIPSQF